MPCKSCRQSAAVAIADHTMSKPESGPGHCRVCRLTRLALLWTFGVGGGWIFAVYWFVGFGACACAR
jgi:hypothetical protein